MSEKLKSSLWSDFSARVVAMSDLPNGTDLRLYRKSDHRRVRSDLAVKRKHVTAGKFESLDDGDTVSTFLLFVKSLLSTDIEARGLELRLYGPDGSRIFGNTHIGTIKSQWGISRDESSFALKEFWKILGRAGLHDIAIRQANRLFTELQDLVGPEFTRRLSETSSDAAKRSEG